MKMIKFDSENKPKKTGFYLVKAYDYTESGYCIAEWNSVAEYWACDVNGSDITGEVTYFSKSTVEDLA